MRGVPPGRIRIVAGAKRGRRLRVAAGAAVRPTSERVREAVFDVLGSVADLTVLDLFAGTGAMGLEALSRGARSCVFVEEDEAVAQVLRSNIGDLGYERASTVIPVGYERALSTLSAGGRRFDLLFVDPPYRMLQQVEVLLEPLVGALLSPGGVAVVEGHRSSRALLGRTPLFERVYGRTRVTMIKNEEE